jgi:hypothetical protein
VISLVTLGGFAHLISTEFISVVQSKNRRGLG